MLQVSIEYLVPGIGQARQAPVDAIRVMQWIRLLLFGQELTARLGVYRRVRVDPVLRQLSDVEERDRDLHLRDHARDHVHHALIRAAPPVFLPHHRLRLVEALDPVLIAPVLAPAQ